MAWFEMDIYTLIFLGGLIFSFALVCLGAGIFTTYFGSGKSRIIGVTLLVVGIIVLVIGIFAVSERGLWATVWKGVIGIIGLAVGGVVAIAIFLFAIMKS